MRFKNQGLDSVEVQDNGSGITPQNYEGLALKHHTSKLSTYADLGTLRTFGFRGEALSSLCALSHFTVVTCVAADVPKGTKLEFETSGRLQGTSVVASQRGTTVSVENLFKNLPVRRRELERNIKREWGKVISLLNQYACVQTGVKFTVSQQPSKGKRMVLFSTKGNTTTRENIVNVFGAKTMNALIQLDLELELEPTSRPTVTGTAEGVDNGTKTVRILGHVSRPAHGEGRQTPDRQMFYVNGRPCQLPQFAKVFNEVYKSYNGSQSPFIFADIQLDTHLYDVNVSPDKRTILLHDQGKMLDTLRESLVELFEKQDITVPISALPGKKTAPLAKFVLNRQDTPGSEEAKTAATSPGEGTSLAGHTRSRRAPSPPGPGSDSSGEEAEPAPRSKPASKDAQALNLISRWVERKTISSKDQHRSAGPGRPNLRDRPALETTLTGRPQVAEGADRLPIDPSEESTDSVSPPKEEGGDSAVESESGSPQVPDTRDSEAVRADEPAGSPEDTPPTPLRQSQEEVEDEAIPVTEAPIPAIATPSRPVASRTNVSSVSRTPARRVQETAIITIGDQTTTSIIGSTAKRQRLDHSPGGMTASPTTPKEPDVPLPSFRGRLTQMFAASAATRRAGGGGLEKLADADEESQSDQEDEDIEEISADEQDGSEAEDEPSPQPSEVADSGETGVDEELRSNQDEEQEDGGYVDEDEKKATEELKVEEMIQAAEEAAEQPSEELEKRSQAFLKGVARRKDSTLLLEQRLDVDEGSIKNLYGSWAKNTDTAGSNVKGREVSNGLETDDAEEKLSLIISKSDFSQMQIIGQFNLGFVLAVRESDRDTDGSDQHVDDELFIIDQHASDEKYNFERLQANTVVQSQRLVRPKQLDLTAIEEEIIIENEEALEANGFMVKVDKSGETPVGARCQLLSLPLSRETTFSLADLEELISLLGDGASATTVPRPSRVRKMFAMRACRSSIMIGKALSRRQMENVVRHMGEMEKPWNCPHGRPTMRHLCSLSAWDGRGWIEGDDFDGPGEPTDWEAFLNG